MSKISIHLRDLRIINYNCRLCSQQTRRGPPFYVRIPYRTPRYEPQKLIDGTDFLRERTVDWQKFYYQHVLNFFINDINNRIANMEILAFKIVEVLLITFVLFAFVLCS